MSRSCGLVDCFDHALFESDGEDERVDALRACDLMSRPDASSPTSSTHRTSILPTPHRDSHITPSPWLPLLPPTPPRPALTPLPSLPITCLTPSHGRPVSLELTSRSCPPCLLTRADSTFCRSTRCRSCYFQAARVHRCPREAEGSAHPRGEARGGGKVRGVRARE